MQIEHTLTVTRRERTGSRYARRERDAGRLPAVLYGHGRPPVALSLNAKEAVRFFHSGERVFNIELASEGVTQAVLLKDLQYDYLGTNIVHVDLTRVDLDERVESAVPIRFSGEAPGMKTAGAVFTQPIDTLTVRCTVETLPESVAIDISGLEAGASLLAGDVALPDGVELAGPADEVVASIVVQQAEDAVGEGESVGGAAGEPEVMREKKPEGGGD